MESIEYIAEMLSDGHLSIPDTIIRKLNLKSHSQLRISILALDTPKKGLSRFKGKWQDDREAVTIVKSIYKSRDMNRRCNKIEL